GRRGGVRAVREDRPRRRGARFGLLRFGGRVRLRARALRDLGRDRRAPAAAGGPGGRGRHVDHRRWLLLQDADRAAERAATAAHRAGDRPRHGGVMARNRRDPLLLELLDWRPEAGVLSVYVSVDPADRSRSWRIALREQLGAIVGDAAGDASRRALEAA